MDNDTNNQLDIIRDLLQKAHRLYILGRVRESTQIFDQACSIDGELVVALLNSEEAEHYNEIAKHLGFSYAFLKLHQYDEALAHCQIILEQDPNNSNALNNSGLALINIGDFEAGITFLEKAVKADPNGSTQVFNLAAAKAEQEAKKQFKNVSEILKVQYQISKMKRII